MIKGICEFDMLQNLVLGNCCSFIDVRLGNDFFKDIAFSVAKQVPLIMILWPLYCSYAGEIKGPS